MAAILLGDGSSYALPAGEEDFFHVDMPGNITLNSPSRPAPWKKVIVSVKAIGAARTAAFVAGEVRFGSDIPALTETADGKTDYIGLLYNPNDRVWDVVSYAKGY